MAYIKLGPRGDYFASSRLGVYLSPGNATWIEDSILLSRLYNFMITGFFVSIPKHEFDNIKIDRRNIRNIPLQFVGVNQPYFVEPLISIISQPPNDPATGDRYLIWSNPSGEWQGRKNYIAEFDGSNWVYTEPFNGLTVPIYNLGISIHYRGTYPSGNWDIDDDGIEELRVIISDGSIDDGSSIDEPTENDWATRPWVLQLINQEAQSRLDGDNNLLRIINQLKLDKSIPTASQVTIIDSGNYFEGGTVEIALQEIGRDITDLTNDLGLTKTNLNNLQTAFNNFINNWGNNQNATISILGIQVNELNYNHGLGYIPQVSLYTFEPLPGQTTITNTTVLTGVLAKPYSLTHQQVRYKLPKNKNIVLILSK